MEQTQVKKKEEKKSPLEKLGDKFNEVKAEKIAKPDRKVVLLIQECCGCGCSDLKIERMVPFDSKLKSGDRITDLQKGDVPL